MLIDLDDTLYHQDAKPFALASTTDPRFFDRYWIEANDPRGEMAIAAGMAIYKNTNAIDGFVMIRRHGIQYNIRVARPLDLDFSQQVGPLRIEVVKPLQELRLVLEDTHGLSAEFLWRGCTYPLEEKRHYLLRKTHVLNDYLRYDQFGKSEGHITIDGERHEFDDWWGNRDHSWGVRPNQGGFDIRIGRGSQYEGGLLYQYACWGNDNHAGYVQIHKTGTNQKTYIDGKMRFAGEPEGTPALNMVDGDVSVEFVPGTRVYSKAGATFTTEDGRDWEIVAKPLGPAYALHGSGYDRGFNDGRAQGFHRDHLVVEHDRYDISDLAKVTMLDTGEPVHGFHREQAVAIVMNGEETALGHYTIIPFGNYKLPPKGEDS